MFARLKQKMSNNMCKVQIAKGLQQISTDNPVSVVIPDEIEGDCTLVFKMVNDGNNRSYTNIDCEDEHHATISITNASGNGVRSDRKILLGTYKKDYELYLSFVLFTENDKWLLEYVFYYDNKIKDGDKK